jgi:hypothetical protein
MVQQDEYHFHAAKCQNMAEHAGSNADRGIWHKMAETWLLLGAFRRNAEEQLDGAKRDLAALQDKIPTQHQR